MSGENVNKNAFVVSPVGAVGNAFILDSGASEHMTHSKELILMPSRIVE